MFFFVQQIFFKCFVCLFVLGPSCVEPHNSVYAVFPPFFRFDNEQLIKIYCRSGYFGKPTNYFCDQTGNWQPETEEIRCGKEKIYFL